MKTNISKNKVLQIIGVAVLCAVCVLGAVLGVVFGMNHSSEDLNVSKDMSDRKPDDSFVMETQAEQGISLLMSNATTADDGTTSRVLTATITPDDVTVKNVAWTCCWENSSADWAKDKDVSDYISVEPFEDDPLKATVVCKQTFGSRILIKVRTMDDSNLSATCKCDYIKRIEKINLKVPKSLMSDDNGGFDTAVDYDYSWCVKVYPYVGDTGSGKFVTSIVWGVGTVEEDVSVSVSYYLNDSYYTSLSSSYVGGPTIPSEQRFNSGNTDCFHSSKEYCKTLFGENFYTDNAYQNSVIRALQICNKPLTFKVVAVGEHNNYSIEYQGGIITGAMYIKATAVAIDESSLKF